MCFQATFAALVCLTAFCVGLSEGYLLTLPFQLHAKSSDIEAYEEAVSWFGKGRGLFYLHTHSGEIEIYDFLNFKIPVFYINFLVLPFSF